MQRQIYKNKYFTAFMLLLIFAASSFCAQFCISTAQPADAVCKNSGDTAFGFSDTFSTDISALGTEFSKLSQKCERTVQTFRGSFGKRMLCFYVAFLFKGLSRSTGYILTLCRALAFSLSSLTVIVYIFRKDGKKRPYCI